MIGRSARDAIFLERAPTSWLPWMYFFSALAVALIGLIYGRLAERFRRVFLTWLAAPSFSGS